MNPDMASIVVQIHMRHGHKTIDLATLANMFLGVHDHRKVRFATAWELLVPMDVFERAAPMLERLRSRTITRRRYRLLRALIVENAVRTGQPDETAGVLRALDQQWAACPLRYLWV
jgi:hypothetical protein